MWWNRTIRWCGECGGGGIPKGDCDCDGNVLDCNDECGGIAELDCNGVGGGTSVEDECGMWVVSLKEIVIVMVM